MNSSQRQAAFDRFFADLARRRSKRLGLGYAGTIRKLSPPALPGEAQGPTRYFLNAVAADGRGSGLVPLGATADAALLRAEKWVQTGKGASPSPPGRPAALRR
ncbi:MAG TPA: hypothetical protein VII43_05410 [Opitutaceae bacterium]